MSRRPSIIGSLMPGSEPEPEAPATATAAPSPALKPKGPDIVHTSLYVPRASYRKLQEIALTQDRKVHDVLMDGIDAVLKEHGHAPTERRKRGPKAAS
ncbi:hypothetical protein [Tardiphaga sp.]|uniref:hypothetical protein n=1 Tax=Tardiphaga sp. TaxID=1926292 RepID=UPI0025D8ADDE|nr:hypothetical protein [Tardiphaga sp.]